MAKRNTLDVKQELMYIVEHPNGQVTVMMDQDHMNSLSPSERETLIRSLFLLGSDQLSREIASPPPDVTIEISPDPAHANVVSAVSFLVSSVGIFDMIVYFGGAADPQVSWVRALKHVLETIDGLRDQMF